MPTRKEEDPGKKEHRELPNEKEPKKDKKKEDEEEEDEGEESEIDRKAKRLLGRIDAASRNLRGHKSRGGQ